MTFCFTVENELLSAMCKSSIIHDRIRVSILTVIVKTNVTVPLFFSTEIDSTDLKAHVLLFPTRNRYALWVTDKTCSYNETLYEYQPTRTNNIIQQLTR